MDPLALVETFQGEPMNLPRITSSKILLAFLFPISLATMIWADTALETETGDLGKKGESNFSQGVQFEKAPDGETAFLLNQYEYAVTDRAEILIEPFFYEIGIPDGGKMVGGIGDLEITPSYMVILEGKWNPAIVTSFKIKVPTARNTDIGTRKFDYYPYLIFGKHIGKLDLNANLGVTFFGQPDEGPHLDNEFIYDLAGQTLLTERLQVILEVFGNSAASAGESGTFAGSTALEYEFSRHFNAYVAVGYDTDKLFNIRPGFNIPF
jgi:hypothetical protein